MEASLIAYAQILREKVFGSDGFEMLLNLFKTIAFLPRPSKQRDQEFIDIYWRLFKSVILFHDAQGMVTVESISNVQEILDEIKAISDKADKGIADGSRLHKDLSRQIMFLQYEMNLNTKKLLAQANDKDKVTESAEETTNSEELGLDEPGPSSRSFSRR